jgi:hypothetical protein
MTFSVKSSAVNDVSGHLSTMSQDITMAVAVGFEPTVEFPQHTLSRRAPLAARTRHQA